MKKGSIFNQEVLRVMSTLGQQDLLLLRKYGKASNVIGGYASKPFTDLPYGVVRKDLPHLQSQDDHEAYVHLILSCQFGAVDLRDASPAEVMAFILWINKQQERIYMIEKKYLSSDPDPMEEASGLKKLDEFGALSTIHHLAQGDILRHPQIEALPYYKVYEVLKLEKTNRDIGKAYESLLKKAKK